MARFDTHVLETALDRPWGPLSEHRCLLTATALSSSSESGKAIPNSREALSDA